MKTFNVSIDTYLYEGRYENTVAFESDDYDKAYKSYRHICDGTAEAEKGFSNFDHKLVALQRYSEESKEYEELEHESFWAF